MSSQATPSLTVVVGTYNGAAGLPVLLAALEQQTVSGFELLMVVDGSTDDTMALLRAYKPQNFTLRTIYQHNRGRSATRNRGGREAHGPLLVFFDQDMRPEPHCLAHHVAHHSQHANTLASGALAEDGQRTTNDFHHYKTALSNGWMAPLAAIEGAMPQHQLFLTAANFSVHKAVFVQLEGFEERVNDAEDYDLAVRAYEQGLGIYYIKAAVAWHEEQLTCRSYVNRQRQYRRAHLQLRALRPHWYRNGPYRTGMDATATGLKRAIYALFGWRYWVRTVDGRNWLRRLPRPIRYRLYGLIVMAWAVYYPEKELP